MRGEVAEVIPAYVEEHEIDLVVMGTVARTGIAGLVMGNTAERVLPQLHGSVAAVKPPGYVDPCTQYLTLRPATRARQGSSPRHRSVRKR